MRLLMIIAWAALAAVAPCQVVINEFSYDDSGTDDREFVELYNAGTSAVDIGDWLVEGVDEAFPADNNADYTIPTGTMLAAGDYYVLGAGTVPNVDLIVGATNLWENSEELIILRDSTGAIMDSVCYEGNKIDASFPTQFIEGESIWGNFASLDATNQSWSRWIDGLDTNNNGADFGLRPATPGATNDSGVSGNYNENFDGLAVDSAVPNWTGSFVNPRAADPTAVGAANPNAIAASPQGGNCLIMWDDSGGGNTGHFDGAPSGAVSFEAYVYFAAGNLTCPDFESWSIGVRGTGATFHNHPNPDPSNSPCAGALGTFNGNGNTGVHWFYVNDGSGGLLRLIDENDGGPDEKILTEIQVMAGVNDGWQRLRLSVSEDVVDASFGGTLGNVFDGTRIIEQIDLEGVGGVYTGYREFIVGNSNARPLTIDAVTIGTPATTFSSFITQPLGPNSLQFEMRGMVLGAEIYNILSTEPCPGGVGTGPYAGLCNANLNVLLAQATAPLGTFPFHFIAPVSRADFGPFFGVLPSGTVIEHVGFQVIGGILTDFAPARQFVMP